jgi:Holliday junction resolvasome RuvABC DNA-binding subunit
MAKELKTDERILRDQIIRKSAVDNMTNIAKQREDLKQGIMPSTPIRKSATELAEDRTVQAGEALQNLIDLGFKESEAHEIASTLTQEDRVAFNRAYPQIKTDFESRFNVKNTTPAFFTEYINKYLEVLKASSGVPNNLGYLQDNIITTPNDLLKLVIPAEVIGQLQNNLRASMGLTMGSPLDVLLTELQLTLPNNDFLNSLNIAMGDNPVLAFRAIQVVLENTNPLPNYNGLKKIVADGKTSNAQKIQILLNKLGTLTTANINALRNVKNRIITGFPVVASSTSGTPATPPRGPPTTPTPSPIPLPAPPSPAPPSPAPPSPSPGSALPKDVEDFINEIRRQTTAMSPSASSAEYTKSVAQNCHKLCSIDSYEFYVFGYAKNGDYYGIIIEFPISPPEFAVVRDKMTFTQLKAIVAVAPNQVLTNKYNDFVKANGLKKGATAFSSYMLSGTPITINSRMSGAGLRKSSKVKSTTKSSTSQNGLKPIRLGKGFENKNDPYKTYDEELKLTPISVGTVITKKPPKPKSHTVSEGVEGSEYEQFDDKANRYIAFGKYAINMRQLKKGVLQIVYKSLAPNPSFPSKKIGSELQQYLFELLTNKKSLPALYKHVPEDEKKMFEKLAIFAGVFDKLNLPRMNSLEDEKKEMDRFKLLHGEFIAGNDNTGIVRELRNLILKFLAENRISKAKAYEYLLELNNA